MDILPAATPIAPPAASTAVASPSHWDIDSIAARGVPIVWSLAGALAILILGRLIAKLLVATLGKVLERGKTDAILIKFLCNLVYAGLLALITISALERLGVNTTTFAAVIAAAGLAVAFALQGSLSNFASGVMLILAHHFQHGDLIEAGGQKGIVDDLHIFWTVLHAEDGTKIVCPNSAIAGGVIKVFKKP